MVIYLTKKEGDYLKKILKNIRRKRAWMLICISLPVETGGGINDYCSGNI